MKPQDNPSYMNEPIQPTIDKQPHISYVFENSTVDEGRKPQDKDIIRDNIQESVDTSEIEPKRLTLGENIGQGT